MNETSTIGKELISYADREEAFSARGVLGELFPFVFQAAKRMSTRAISRWLAESYGVKISAVSIAKALRNEEKHWRQFAESIEPHARRVESATGIPMEEFMKESDIWKNLTAMPTEKLSFYTASIEAGGSDIDDYHDSVSEISERWFSLGEPVYRIAFAYLMALNDEAEDIQE